LFWWKSLQLFAICIDFVVTVFLDVWINNNGDAAMTLLNFRVKLLDLGRSEILRVVNEVVIVALAILVRPLYIHPEHIHWEFVIREVSISFDHHLSVNICPLAEMEA